MTEDTPIEFKDEYDVIIVGAGPGGSIAARDCAEKGLDTLVIEKRPELGTPVRCGEGLGEVWMEMAGLEYDPDWCKRETKGAVVYPPNEKSLKIDPENNGYIIERKIFEKKLAEQAGRKGADYMLKTHAKRVIQEENEEGEEQVKGVVVENDQGETEEYRAKIVIAADGVESKIAKSAGIDTSNPVKDMDSGYEYEMTNLNFPEEESKYIHIWLGNEISPGGYIWAFFKEEDTANIGIGVNPTKAEKTAKEYLDEWIKNHPEYFKDAAITEKKGGGIPLGEPIQEPYTNGLMVIGDAAHMVNPIHGGGMGQAMEAARIAAETAEKAIQKQDYSAELLSEFAERWWEKRGNQLKDIQKVRNFAESLTDKDLNKLREIIGQEEVLDLVDASNLKKFLKIFKGSPKIAMKAVKHLK